MQYKRIKFGNVSGGKGGLFKRKLSFLNPFVGSYSIFIRAWLWRVTGSSSSSFLGGISYKASCDADSFFIANSIAAFKLNASINAVSLRTYVFPTDLTSTPSELDPTPSSGCSLTPFSIMSARCFKLGASYLSL